MPAALAHDLIERHGASHRRVERTNVAAHRQLDELVAVLAGQAAGGEEGPVHSAGLLVVADLDWPIVGLRMDWGEEGPVERLYEAWKVYEPQIQAYITRARDPRAAPTFGVPGNP